MKFILKSILTIIFLQISFFLPAQDIMTMRNGGRSIQATRALKFEFMSPATNHIGINFEQTLKDQVGFELKVGIIGVGAPTYGEKQEYSYSYNEYEGGYHRTRDVGFFVKAGPKLMMGQSNSLRGWYFKPEVVYSMKHYSGGERHNSSFPGEEPFNHDYTYDVTEHSIGLLGNIGYQAIVADQFTFDVNMGFGFSAQPDQVETTGKLPEYGAYFDEETYFRYSHMQFNGIAVSMGLAFGVLLK